MRCFIVLLIVFLSLVECSPLVTTNETPSALPTSSGHHPNQKSLRTTRLHELDEPFFDDYRPLETITEWLKSASELFPGKCRLIDIGTSFEGRNIPAVRISNEAAAARDPSRSAILVIGGSHAREWIGVSSVNYIIHRLLADYSASHSIQQLLQTADVILAPVLNVDGYVYTWEHDRLWRKSRQPTPNDQCVGLDLDRSWGFQWPGNPEEDSPCSEAYPGSIAFEAVESKALASWARNQSTVSHMRLVGFLDLHSYSQRILYPYSYTCEQDPPNLEDLQEVGLRIAKAMHHQTGEHYDVVPACQETGTRADTQLDDHAVSASAALFGGSAIDYFYHELKVKYAYEIKLRDTGNFGFQLPKENIIPAGEEALAAVVQLGLSLSSSNAG